MPTFPGACRVQLPAEFRQQQREVAPVLDPVPVLGQSARDGKLPIDVDAVEHRRKATDEELDRGRDQGAARLRGRRRVREVLRPAPTAEGDQDAQVREALLQLAQLAKVRHIQSRIAERGPPVRGEVPEGVQDVGQPIGGNVCDPHALRPYAPGGEVGNDLGRGLRGGRRRGCGTPEEQCQETETGPARPRQTRHACLGHTPVRNWDSY